MWCSLDLCLCRLILESASDFINRSPFLFRLHTVASSMNTIEFQLREFNTGSFPRGLSFMLGVMSKWLYDNSPTGALKFEEPLAQLKAQIAASGSKVFQDMIKELLLENTHRVTVEMVPSKTLEAEQLKEEQDRLAAIKESLGDDELDEIIKKTSELKELQAAEDPPEARAEGQRRYCIRWMEVKGQGGLRVTARMRVNTRSRRFE